MQERNIYPTWNFWGAQIVLLMIHLLIIFQRTWTLPFESVWGLILMWRVRWSFLIIFWCNRDLDILNISIVWFLVASQLDHSVFNRPKLLFPAISRHRQMPRYCLTCVTPKVWSTSCWSWNSKLMPSLCHGKNLKYPSLLPICPLAFPVFTNYVASIFLV